jgi:hypothetical protein
MPSEADRSLLNNLGIQAAAAESAAQSAGNMESAASFARLAGYFFFLANSLLEYEELRYDEDHNAAVNSLFQNAIVGGVIVTTGVLITPAAVGVGLAFATAVSIPIVLKVFLEETGISLLGVDGDWSASPVGLEITGTIASDEIVPTRHSDTIKTSLGTDTINYANFNDGIYVTQADFITVNHEGGVDEIHGAEWIRGTQMNDFFVYNGSYLGTRFYGEGGGDTFSTWVGADATGLIDGGDGTDLLIVTSGGTVNLLQNVVTTAAGGQYAIYNVENVDASSLQVAIKVIGSDVENLILERFESNLSHFGDSQIAV